jgi:hypothetical protein
MTTDADGEGYHCINCGKQVGYLGCPDCFPEDFEEDNDGKN